MHTKLFYERYKKHLFDAEHINWSDANGNLRKHWIKHFKKLGIPTPKSVLATNPTDLSESYLLQRIE